MSPSLELRHITLRVPDLARSVAFYRRIGFAVVSAEAAMADLAVAPGAPAILRLVEAGTANAAPRAAAGLFHAALVFPNRGALGRWLQHAAGAGIEFDGFSDHAVSEAIYFSDPDENGLEFYVDRPRETWPVSNDGVAMMTKPLDLQSLISKAPPPTEWPLEGAAWGHLHLRVTNLDRSEEFYTQRLGMQVTQRNYPGARFLATDGYHHHLGLNVWGQPRVAQPNDALGLAEATFARPDASGAVELRDPDNIALRIEPL